LTKFKNSGHSAKGGGLKVVTKTLSSFFFIIILLVLGCSLVVVIVDWAAFEAFISFNILGLSRSHSVVNLFLMIRAE